MKIAAAQTPVAQDIGANGDTIRNVLRAAHAQGIALVVFCEGALSGYAKSQIKRPDEWHAFDWAAQRYRGPLRHIGHFCGHRGRSQTGCRYPPAQ
ncbi:MAG TPA: hypothetical protein VN036_03275 [Devosia sp.]|nr:hypothetical protein [Devosia sp.]